MIFQSQNYSAFFCSGHDLFKRINDPFETVLIGIGYCFIVKCNFNAGNAGGQTSIEWLGRKPTALFLSDTSEKRGPALCGPISVPALGLTTLRVEFGE